MDGPLVKSLAAVLKYMVLSNKNSPTIFRRGINLFSKTARAHFFYLGFSSFREFKAKTHIDRVENWKTYYLWTFIISFLNL